MTSESVTSNPAFDYRVWRDFETDLPRWEPPLGGANAVVVAPHPDDETLACGGLMQRLEANGWSIELILATDGEASHGPNGAQELSQLAKVRDSELAASLAVMSLAVSPQHLALPDSAVHQNEAELRFSIQRMTENADLIIAPHPCDWHSDHEAVGRAALHVASRAKIPLLAYGVWLWSAVSPTDQRFDWGAAIALDLTSSEVEAKRRAIASYQSQLGGDEPVVPESLVAHHSRATEIYFPLVPGNALP